MRPTRTGKRPPPRLMLIEFFREALRGNDRSMLFPFLQGLARARGVETLWLCYGGGIAHSPEAAAGRTLFASLPEDDLRTLARHVARFRPTHVVTSDLLSPEAKALLEGSTPPITHLRMPEIAERPDGLVHPVRHGDIARCGWFLDWLGVKNTSRPGPHLVEAAVPDYSAVMANAAAKTATPHITILSGVLCANRRTIANNPQFAGLDLGGDEYRGCTFCDCPSDPSYTSPRADILTLIETQFRRIRETAGKVGRDKGRYEIFDIHAFWKFDKLFEVILRLKVPPATFLFNPRIDDVLRHRDRIGRVLPALAKAGHEVHILSMGVENFSRRENERFNKDISVAQVDAFLALTKEWENTHGQVFKPFKAGHGFAELGLILFTPWTKLEDIRINLTHAAARHFPERGYWLYSILLIETTGPDSSPNPLFRLARKDGLLCDRLPDRGQVYGLSKDGEEMHASIPWRFQDAKVADYFAMLVRVCAADREGADCAFFREDPEFELALSLLRGAGEPDKPSPLKIAFALLDIMEAARPPYSRADILRAAARAAAPPPPRPRPAPPQAPEISVETKVVARLFERLRGSRPAMFSGVVFKGVEEVAASDGKRIRLTFSLSGRALILDLLDARSQMPCFIESRRFRAVYHDAARPPSTSERKKLEKLLWLIDDVVGAARKTT